MPDNRRLPPYGAPFTAHRDTLVTRITEVEGRKLSSPVELRQLMVTPGMVLVETRFAAGDCWYNALGVTHHLEAIEPTTCVEIKNPPIKTW